MHQALGLLILRLTAGGIMLAAHGWPKLIGFTSIMDTFPDPFHVGSATSLALAVFAEFFCGFFIVFGLATRWATVPLIVTMAVAAFLIHGEDPFGKKELALVYLLMYAALFFTGPGQWSLDHIVRGKKK